MAARTEHGYRRPAALKAFRLNEAFLEIGMKLFLKAMMVGSAAGGSCWRRVGRMIALNRPRHRPAQRLRNRRQSRRPEQRQSPRRNRRLRATYLEGACEHGNGGLPWRRLLNRWFRDPRRWWWLPACSRVWLVAKLRRQMRRLLYPRPPCRPRHRRPRRLHIQFLPCALMACVVDRSA